MHTTSSIHRPWPACVRGLLPLSIAVVLFATPFLAAQESKTEDTDQQPSQQGTAAAADQGPEQAKTGQEAKFSWDTTIKYSNFFRVARQNPKIINTTGNAFNINQDDGDRNFHGGLASDRVDLYSEMELTFGNFGVRGSMEAWGDPTYNQRTANNSPQTCNNLSGDCTHFPGGTKDFEFTNAQLMDAFFFAKGHIGQRAVSFRAGQFSQFWGESLFFGNNGIAGGMAPIDVIKALSVPNWTFRELILPVPQVSVGFELAPNVSIGAYYQLMWREDWLPGAGSYFSQLDFQGTGEGGNGEGGKIIAGPPLMPGGGPAAFFPTRNLSAKNSGQFGAQVKVRGGHGIDLGFYAIQFHEKTPVPILIPAQANPGVPFNPVTGEIGLYNWVYPEDVKAYGISATKTVGVVNWAAEISGRTNQDLTNDAATMIGGVGNNSNHPLYAVGDSIHGNFSGLATFGKNFIAKESTLLGEIAWNRLLCINHNPALLDPGATRDGVGFRLLYTPTYRQVRSGLDLSFPFNFAFFPMGKSSVIYPFGPDKGGDFTISVNASYLDAWRFSLGYTRFYGTPAGALYVNPAHPGPPVFTYDQPYADRGYIAFSVYRSIGLRKGRQ